MLKNQKTVWLSLQGPQNSPSKCSAQHVANVLPLRPNQPWSRRPLSQPLPASESGVQTVLSLKPGHPPMLRARPVGGATTSSSQGCRAMSGRSWSRRPCGPDKALQVQEIRKGPGWYPSSASCPLGQPLGARISLAVKRG